MRKPRAGVEGVEGVEGAEGAEAGVGRRAEEGEEVGVVEVEAVWIPKNTCVDPRTPALRLLLIAAVPTVPASRNALSQSEPRIRAPPRAPANPPERAPWSVTCLS